RHGVPLRRFFHTFFVMSAIATRYAMCPDLPLPLSLLLGSHPIRWAAGIAPGGGLEHRVER
ncbi:MAG: hypothetical protein WB763_05410, partial [Terriglobia bacterium]